MGATVKMDIELQRNATFARQFALTDDTGAALDLTGATFAFDVKARAGDPDPPLASATVTVVNAAGGLVKVVLAGSLFAAIDGDYEAVRLAYDFIGTQAGISTVLARGTLTLLPGVS